MEVSTYASSDFCAGRANFHFYCVSESAENLGQLRAEDETDGREAAFVVMDRGSAPWLSVVMPVFNGEEFLDGALESVFRSSAGLERVEVIVVDDGSTDRSKSIAREYCDNHGLRLFERQESGGWVVATNAGLREVRGEFCCFLHQDDRWLPPRLPWVLKTLAAQPGLDLLLTAARIVGPDGRSLGTWQCPLPTGQVLSPSLLVNRLLVQNFVSIDAPVFRTALLQRFGDLDPGLWYTADWDYWLRLAAGGAKAMYVGEKTVDFRVHGKSQTAVKSIDEFDFRRQIETVHERHIGPDTPKSTVQAAEFSLSLNVALANGMHGRPMRLFELGWKALRLGPRASWTFFRDSRLFDRILPRLILRFTGRL